MCDITMMTCVMACDIIKPTEGDITMINMISHGGGICDATPGNSSQF